MITIEKAGAQRLLITLYVKKHDVQEGMTLNIASQYMYSVGTCKMASDPSSG